MMLRRTQATQPLVPRFSTLPSTQTAARKGKRLPALERQACSEPRSKGSLFLVPQSRNPRLAPRWKPRMEDGLFLTVALVAMVALCWTLL